MHSAEDEPVHARWAPWVNLLLPGAGLVLIGACWSGLATGLVFAACTNLALASVLLFPDDFSSAIRMLLIGFAGGSYVGAQLRYAQAMRGIRAAELAALRRRVLAETQSLLKSGQPARALEVLSPLARRLPDDLLVAYRLAQVLTETGNKRAARVAWRQLRTLDRHGIYRQEALRNERDLGPATAT